MLENKKEKNMVEELDSFLKETSENYYDAYFTKTEAGLDIEANHVEIGCLTSKKNTIHIDEEGNITCNSITTNQPEEKVLDFNQIYPVGSIYMNVGSVNPSTLFGGVWKQIKGRFLLGTGFNEENTTNAWGSYRKDLLNFPVGELGGEPTHKLSVEEMPVHNHMMPDNDSGYYKGWGSREGWLQQSDIAQGGRFCTDYTGGDVYHNNMPPYLVVSIWKRVS